MPTDDAATPAWRGPITVDERVQLIDVLRGFALMGILVVNMQLFKSATGGTGLPTRFPGIADRAAGWLISLGFESKFFVLFSFLFGYGLAVQMARAEAQGARLTPRYLRRLAGLLLIGLAHALLLFTGDILAPYALLGLVLLGARSAPSRALVTWAGALLVGWTLLLGLFALSLAVTAGEPPSSAGAPGATTTGRVAEARAAQAGVAPPGAARTQAEQTDATRTQATRTDATRADATQSEAGRAQAAYRGTPGEVVAQRARELPQVWASAISFMVPMIVAMFLLGLWAGRRGLLSRVGEHAPLLRRVRMVGLLVGLPGAVLYAAGVRLGGDTPAIALGGYAVGVVAAPCLSAVYTTSIALAHQRPAVARALAPLAPVGRMALTNYLLQSLVCALIFTGYGFASFGQVGPAAGLALSVAIFACQIPLSAWWLRRFRFGPAEWLLRTLTYLRAQPLRAGHAASGPPTPQAR